MLVSNADVSAAVSLLEADFGVYVTRRKSFDTARRVIACILRDRAGTPLQPRTNAADLEGQPTDGWTNSRRGWIKLAEAWGCNLIYVLRRQVSHRIILKELGHHGPQPYQPSVMMKAPMPILLHSKIPERRSAGRAPGDLPGLRKTLQQPVEL